MVDQPSLVWPDGARMGKPRIDSPESQADGDHHDRHHAVCCLHLGIIGARLEALVDKREDDVEKRQDVEMVKHVAERLDAQLKETIWQRQILNVEKRCLTQTERVANEHEERQPQLGRE